MIQSPVSVNRRRRVLVVGWKCWKLVYARQGIFYAKRFRDNCYANYGQDVTCCDEYHFYDDDGEVMIMLS